MGCAADDPDVQGYYAYDHAFCHYPKEKFFPLMNKSLKILPNWPQLSKSFSLTVSPKSCSGGQHGYCSVMLRKYERACGMAGSVDRWLVQLRHTRRSPSRKDESPYCQLFLSARLQNLTQSLFSWPQKRHVMRNKWFTIIPVK